MTFIKNNQTILYLLPVPLGKGVSAIASIPAATLDVVISLDGIIAEDGRNGMRALQIMAGELAKLQGRNFCLKDNLRIEVLNEHSRPDDLKGLIDAILEGDKWALISDAGVPCVADPGSALVRLAHERGIKVMPLPGPSSILLALMASGLDGQNFSFHGYLSRENEERLYQLKKLEKASGTQIFIETPYRNEAVFEQCVKVLNPDTWLSVAIDLTLVSEEIFTKKIKDWRRLKKTADDWPDLRKRPAVFLIGA